MGKLLTVETPGTLSRGCHGICIGLDGRMSWGGERFEDRQRETQLTARRRVGRGLAAMHSSSGLRRHRMFLSSSAPSVSQCSPLPKSRGAARDWTLGKMRVFDQANRAEWMRDGNKGRNETEIPVGRASDGGAVAGRRRRKSVACQIGYFGAHVKKAWASRCQCGGYNKVCMYVLRCGAFSFCFFYFILAGVSSCARVVRACN